LESIVFMIWIDNPKTSWSCPHPFQVLGA